MVKTDHSWLEKYKDQPLRDFYLYMPSFSSDGRLVNQFVTLNQGQIPRFIDEVFASLYRADPKVFVIVFVYANKSCYEMKGDCEYLYCNKSQ